MAFPNKYTSYFYHRHTYYPSLFPSSSLWIPSFSLLALLLHSHLYPYLFFFFDDLVSFTRATYNIPDEGLFTRACTLPRGYNTEENYTLVFNAAVSTIDTLWNQPRCQSKYNGEENKMGYTIDTTWL